MTQVMERAPERTIEQRMDALVLANEVRSYRADLKGEWSGRPRSGRPRVGRSVRDVIMAPTEFEESWKLMDVLLALPKVGRVKANRILRDGVMSPAKTMGGLSDRQRGALLALLPRTR